MKQKSKCICNKCEKEFITEFKNEVIDKDENGKDVIQFFFVCPHCSTRYNSYTEDEKYRELLSKYRKLGSRVKQLARKGANQAQIEFAIKKWQKFEDEILKPYAEELKSKYHNHGVDENDGKRDQGL